MADDLATLNAQRDRLAEIRAKGVRAVEYSGNRVEFRSDEEVAAALADVERRIAALQGTRINTVRIETSKGL
jgi:hypothetical protein